MYAWCYCSGGRYACIYQDCLSHYGTTSCSQGNTHELLLQLQNTVGVDHDQLILEIIMDTPLPDYDVPGNINYYKREMRDTALYSVARVQYSNEQILKYLKHIPSVVRIATKFLRPNMDEELRRSLRDTKRGPSGYSHPFA